MSIMRDGWILRYRELYEPIAKVIELEILPAVSEPVRALADQRINTGEIPFIE